ncbi:MAG: TonB-dependent receptor plug domain-containing protein [Campylobacter sp.]|nr:TonB-dependent receptor plug domain-containing protein [Campylobacter sp.]
MTQECTFGKWEGAGKKFKFSIVALFYIVNLSAADTDGQYELSEVNVDANVTRASNGVLTTVDNFGGKRSVSRELIEATSNKNGDITSLLHGNPAVKFSNANNQSTTQGEIDPAQVSIHGAAYYQNNFQIDGFNMNNDLDPGSSNDYTTANSPTEVPSSASQGINIDTDFIERLDVYDSDVSAKYGGFTGGVIDAKTRDPKEGFHGKFSVAHSRGKYPSSRRFPWTKYNIDEADEESFLESSTAKNQPEFSKWTTRLNLEGFLTDDFGLMFGYAQTRSKIPTFKYNQSSTGYVNGDEKINQRRLSENYFLKGVWYATDRLTIRPQIMYAPMEAKIFSNQRKDSEQDIKSGGQTYNLSAEYEADWAKIEQKIGYSILQTSRDSKNEYLLNWYRSNAKNWNSGTGASANSEGGYGDIDQVQKTFSYDLDFDFAKFDTAWFEHSLRAGLGFNKKSGSYEIKDTFWTTSTKTRGDFSATMLGCAEGDWLCDDSGNVYRSATQTYDYQYARAASVYEAGKISTSVKSWSAYAEDSIKFWRFTIRPGIRFDTDDYMDKDTWAPRFSANFDVWGNNLTNLSFGRNRYYGRNAFVYKTREGRNKLLVNYTRASAYDTNWNAANNYGWVRGSGASTSTYRFDQLDIPYDDETSFGIRQKVGPVAILAKYVKREGRKQVTQQRAADLGTTCDSSLYSSNCYLYTNEGYSDVKEYDISVANDVPLETLGISHSFELTYSHMQKKSNNNGYGDRDADVIEDPEVYYEGNIVRKSSLPTQNYYRPWIFTASLVSHIPQYGLSVSNFLTYEAPMDALVTSNSACGITSAQAGGRDVYCAVDLGASWKWDMKIAYEKKMPKDVSAFVSLDILNITNRKNKTTAEYSSNRTKTTYEPGRQFLVEAGLKW